MADSAYTPRMSWDDPDLPGSIAIFRQQCELYFSVRNIKPEKQVDHVLLFMGPTGIRMYNSWGLTDTHRQDIKTVWERFETQLKPKSNFRVARLYLQKLHQKERESADDFMSRLKLQGQTCQFRDTTEFSDRVIEQFIAGTRHTELQKQLLSKDPTLTIEQCMDLARTHEAAMAHMEQLANVNVNHPTNVNIVHKHDKRTQCGNCGGNHPFYPRTRCPAYNTTCKRCGKRNHWGNVCRSAPQARSDPEGQGHKSRSKNQYHGGRSHGRSQSRNRAQPKHKQDVHMLDSSTSQSESDTADMFEHLSVHTLSDDESRRDVFADIDIRQDSARRIIHLHAKVDTGAQANTIPLRVYRRMYPTHLDADGMPRAGHLMATNSVLTAYNGTPIQQYGTLTLPCKRGQMNWEETVFHVCNTDGPAILGLRTSVQLQLVTLHCPVDSRPSPHKPINSVSDLQSEYPELFDTIGDFPGEYHIVLREGAQPVVHPPRKCSIHIKDELKAELDNMEKLGVIERVTQPTDWVNSIAVSRKSNGQLRICLDPKDLNSQIKRCHHRTPTVEEITHKLSGATVFSKLDAKHGYWSVHLDQESSLLTTFNSPFGRYRYKRMPFGLAMSQDVFQLRMDQILEQCEGVISIADDIVVFGNSEQSHDTNLHRLMDTAARNGLKFNSSKCAIKQKQVAFFGMLYDAQGMHPDPAKVQAIKEMPPPRDKAELQQFLGMATYLSPFIRNMSSLTADLRELLRQENSFVWSDNHQRSFDTIRNQICASATLRYFDPNKETTVQVDASSRGLGATLMQDGEPVAYASKALSDAETRYANIEREMLAVVFGCERFHTYIFGKRFIVESDHKPLQMIHLKPLTSAPPRLQRMLLRLQPYDFVLCYRPGKQIPIADSLSRAPTEDKTHIPLDVQINLVQFSAERLADIKRETERDTVLHSLKRVITSGWPETRNDLAPALRPYWSFRDELAIEDGLIMKGGRVIIPLSLQAFILSKLHEGHQGSTKTKLRAKDCVYWININSDIDDVVSQCAVCQENQRSQPKEPLLAHELPTRPWQILGTDLFYLDGNEYLIIADYYSKFPFIRRLRKNASSSDVINAMQEIFAEHGVPEKVISDNGPHFSASAFHSFTEKWGFTHVTSSPHFPQSNGFVERTIQTVKRTMKKAKSSGVNVNMALLCLRTTPVDSEIPSPAELLCGRKVKSNLPVIIKNNAAQKEHTYQRLHERQTQQKAYFDRSAHDLKPLTPGQLVRIQDTRTGMWTPAQVKNHSDEPRSYIVVTPNGRELRRNRAHIRDIEPSRKRVTFEDDLAQPNPLPSKNTITQDNGPVTTRYGRQVKPPKRLDL